MFVSIFFHISGCRIIFDYFWSSYIPAMKRVINVFFFLVTAIIIIILSGSDASASTAVTNPVTDVPVLVDAAWVKSNLNTQGVVLLHITTTRADYLNGHIPGAQFLWPGDIIVSTPDQSTVPAPVKSVTKRLRELGISNNTHVVLYGKNSSLVQVCRIFVSLEHYGLKGRVSILDGGIDAWKDQGNELTVNPAIVKKGKFSPAILDNIVNGQFVEANIGNSKYFIIDARPPTQYDGSAAVPRSGHIPGAASLSQAGLYDPKSYKFNDEAGIISAFDNSGLTSGKIPLVYCNTGNSASVLYVAARLAGLNPVLYDGSMEEWSNNLSLPMERKQDN